MSSTDKALIERLKELQTDSDKWFATADCAFEENSLDRTGVFNNSYESIYICALRNEAIPLIDRLQAKIEALQAEVERLKGGITKADAILMKSINVPHKVSKLDHYGSIILDAMQQLEARNERIDNRRP